MQERVKNFFFRRSKILNKSIKSLRLSSSVPLPLNRMAIRPGQVRAIESETLLFIAPYYGFECVGRAQERPAPPYWIQPCAWNRVFSSVAISLAVCWARPATVLLPLASP